MSPFMTFLIILGGITAAVLFFGLLFFLVCVLEGGFIASFRNFKRRWEDDYVMTRADVRDYCRALNERVDELETEFDKLTDKKEEVSNG